MLLHVLEDQFKLRLHAEELLAEFAGDEGESTVLNIKGLCGKIQRGMADTRDFEIDLRVILGNFAFQKMAMVKDLQERASDLPVHDVIAALATARQRSPSAPNRKILIQENSTRFRQMLSF